VRRRLLALGFGFGAAAVTAVVRRTARARRDRVDVYFDDGSMISLADGSPEADRLLPLARQILSSARAAR
jgi:hypothetical protein